MDRRRIPLTQRECKDVMEPLFDAVSYCHQKGLVHRDLKLSNILLKDRNELKGIKIIDFGIAGIFSRG
jgi:serine/threonine protein kinase